MYLQQKGIGLIEVLVALLLLTVAILGFSALQIRAVGATDESLVRSRATSVISSLSEAMRDNVKNQEDMYKVFNGTTSLSTIPICLNTTEVCNSKQMAESAAKEIKTKAATENFKVGMIECPGTNKKLYCAIVAWGDTSPTAGDGSNTCTDGNGVYKKGSTCIIMETY